MAEGTEAGDSLVIDKDTNEESDTAVSAAFPYRANVCDLAAYPNRTYPWHWHNDAELFFMHKGSLDYNLPEKTLHFDEGDAGFINANVIHRTVGSPDGECLQQEHIFLPSFLGGGAGGTSAIDEKYIIPLVRARNFEFAKFGASSRECEELKALMRRSFVVFREKPFGFEAEIRSLMTSAWLVVLRERMKSGAEDAAESVDSLRLKKMLAYIEENYSRRITLKEIAAAAAIGERECCRCFAKEIDCSPIDHLIDVRINKARNLLKTTGLKIEAVAAACGFSNPSYFCRTFRKRTGTSPGKSR